MVGWDLDPDQTAALLSRVVLHAQSVKNSILCYVFEPRHEISNNVVCATSKASDQPGHMRSLIRAFASRLNILGVLSY